MANSRVERSKLPVDFAPEGVPYAAILPPGYDQGGPVPLCLVLHGGGGSHQNLVDSKPIYDELWASGAMPPLVLASAGISPLGFYLDHPGGRIRWESFIAQDFIAHLRRTYNVRGDRNSTVISGTSMGGHGSLRIAFRNPDRFAAVAALEPALDPALQLNDVTARNHFFYPLVLKSGGDASADQLVGSNRDAALFKANNPANLAIANADAIRASGLAIYIEAGDEDVFNLHDGAEFLHRVLWDLDISHEYHVARGADHVGPSLPHRMRSAYAWVGSVLTPPDPQANEITSAEGAWVEWMEGRLKGDPPLIDPMSPAMVRAYRRWLASAREMAAKIDPTTNRRYGVLPPVRL
ncbi:MAG: alpha/beta hydrolase-fold protein [Candidatus Binatus sp.]|uniref:alpha/beta hydrolase n=1 Tax=Candidatus Binatus sp. TaxID=2811406 RepID=UPI0027207D79|nr:alpha/beta hydrolase-fold protein [Candidatus Binatus sp.]MDO8433557.1 alpha/beta hydrolase-fold protein [Candidatus Binatus sp.]